MGHGYDGVGLHDMRWSFVRATLQVSKIRLSSATEAVWEPRLTKDRLADDEPSPKRRRIKQKQPNDNNLKETVRTIRQLADAMWKEIKPWHQPAPEEKRVGLLR